MRCIICGKQKTNSHFSHNTPVCNECIDTLETVYNVPYAPPERISTNEAYVRLFLAIKQQAVADDQISDWEAYWMKEPKWRLVWILLHDTANTFRVQSVPFSVL